MTVLELTDVTKEYPVGSVLDGSRGVLRAVDRVSLSVAAGEIVGLVGESGSGKSTSARIAGGLLAPTSGAVSLFGEPLDVRRRRATRHLRAHLGFVFQNPYGSLNPSRTVGDTVAMPLRLHTAESRAQVRRRVLELLDRVGLTPAEEFARKLPRQLSGGQRQRVAIARAIALRPRLLIADEPVSALDVTISSQILNLLVEIQGEIGSSILFISHDLDLVRRLCDTVLVMNKGSIVERGPAEAVFEHPEHPYTQLLLESMPVLLDRRDL